MRAQFVFFVAVALSSGSASSRANRASTTEPDLGPLTLAELAKLVDGIDLKSERGRPPRPFLLEIDPLVAPPPNARLECTWLTGKFPEVRFIDSKTGRETTMEIRQESGPPSVTDDFFAAVNGPAVNGGWMVPLKPRADTDHPIGAWRFDDRLRQIGFEKRATFPVSVRTYEVTVFCSTADRVAFQLSRFDGPLDAAGFAVVAEHSPQGWRIVSLEGLWVS